MPRTSPVRRVLWKIRWDRWRAVNAAHLVVPMRAGPTFIGAMVLEQPIENTEPDAV